MAAPGSIKNGHWCPICARVKTRISLDELQKLASNKGGIYISREEVVKGAKHEWECSKGHRWMAAPGDVRRGQWCRKCYLEKISYSIDDIKSIAKNKGGICHSNIYSDRNSKIEMECSEGHKWITSAYNIIQGSWCPNCSNIIHTSEEIVRQSFEQMTGRKFVKMQPNFLRISSGTILQLDGFCKELNLAFEFNGLQHYEYVPFFHRHKISNFRRQLERDRIKRELCANNNVILITISYEDNLANIREIIRAKIKKFPHLYTQFNFNIKLNPYRQGLSKTRLQELREIANARGGSILSNFYTNQHAKMEFECSEGHRWWARPLHIKRSKSWCPTCAPGGGGIANKLSLNKIRELANERGGKFISVEYQSANKKHEWECSEGHQWMATVASIKHKKSWCPTCVTHGGHHSRLSIDEMKDIALTKGGKCLSKQYKNTQTKLKWECSEGHQWMATAANIKHKKSWCPTCVKGRLKRKSLPS